MMFGCVQFLARCSWRPIILNFLLVSKVNNVNYVASIEALVSVLETGFAEGKMGLKKKQAALYSNHRTVKPDYAFNFPFLFWYIVEVSLIYDFVHSQIYLSLVGLLGIKGTRRRRDQLMVYLTGLSAHYAENTCAILICVKCLYPLFIFVRR